LGKFLKLRLKFTVAGDGRVGFFSLSGSFEKKLVNEAGSHALDEIVEWTMFVSILAAAIPFSTSQKLSYARSPKAILGNSHFCQ
jgi:hypothetical protein